MGDKYGYISIETLLDFCQNSKDHAVTPNDFMRMARVRVPERKTGKWINANDGKWNTVEVLKCSVCGEMDNRMYRTDKFCPNCGARMEG